MTTESTPKHGAGGFRWFLDSMWGFWLLLLTVSFAVAIAIYYLWLRGGSSG